GRRRHHVESAWTYGAGADHGAPPPRGFREGDRGMSHGLLVVPAEGRQGPARGVQRLTQSRDVAVAEDGPRPGKVAHRGAAFVDVLAGEIPHGELSGGETNPRHI